MKRSVFVLHKHLLTKKERAHWDIRVKANSHLEEWNIYRDPLSMKMGDKEEVRKKTCQDLTWLIAEGKRKVGGAWTWVQILDRGEVLINQKDPSKAIFVFKGKLLKGKWILGKEGSRWIFSRLS